MINVNEPDSEIESGAALGLTLKQKEFVRLMTAEGMCQTKAAEAAGFSFPSQEASRLVRLPHVRAALHAARQAAIEGELASLGLRTMRELMTDATTPAPVRFQAAKWSIEAAGHGAAARQAAAGLPASEKALHEMSVEELEAFIQRGDAALSGLRRVGGPVIDLPAPDSLPDSAPDSAQTDAPA